MITHEDIKQAIAECQGVRNPNARTCIKLAAFLTIQEYMFGGEQELAGESYAGQPCTVSAMSGSQFSQVIDGKSWQEVFAVLDDAMNSVKYFTPKLYEDTIKRLQEI